MSAREAVSALSTHRSRSDSGLWKTAVALSSRPARYVSRSAGGRWASIAARNDGGGEGCPGFSGGRVWGGWWGGRCEWRAFVRWLR